MSILKDLHQKSDEGLFKFSFNVKGGFKLSFYSGLKMYDLGGLGIDRCQAI